MSKLRKDFDSEYDWLVYCADHGASDLQLHLAFKILLTRTDANRVIDAYKWLFLAHYIGNRRAGDTLTFIHANMTDDQLVEANAMIDSWIQSKQVEVLAGQNKNWTNELKKVWAD
jgi:hypothetical protein